MINSKDMSTDSIEERLSAVSIEIAQIKSQVEHAASEAREYGDYSDSDWFFRAKSALRFKGIEHQQLLKELAKRKKEDRVRFNLRFERVFVEVARTRIDPVLFQQIKEEANFIATNQGAAQ